MRIFKEYNKMEFIPGSNEDMVDLTITGKTSGGNGYANTLVTTVVLDYDVEGAVTLPISEFNDLVSEGTLHLEGSDLHVIKTGGSILVFDAISQEDWDNLAESLTPADDDEDDFEEYDGDLMESIGKLLASNALVALKNNKISSKKNPTMYEKSILTGFHKEWKRKS